LSDFGLVIVAPHRQKATNEQLKAKAQALGIRFSVTETGDLPGRETKGIPSVVLFDHTGKVIYEGGPDGSEAKMRAAVGAALVETAEIGTPEKALTAVVDGLKKGQLPLASVTKLQNFARGSDAATAAQAKKLVDAILASAQKRLDGASELAKDEPLAAYESVQRIATNFKATPLGPKAAELAGKLKANKAVQAELKAKPSLEQIKKLDALITAKAGKLDLTSPEVKKAFAAQLKQMGNVLQQMKKAYADTHATAEAEEIAAKYDIGK
jgi:hypothetical protein